jgi:hypothetical protein
MEKTSTRNPAGERGEDFVTFALKPEAPDYVALGRTRYAGEFRRSEEPFRATRGEWKVFLERTGFFEQIEPSGDRAIGPSEGRKDEAMNR